MATAAAAAVSVANGVCQAYLESKHVRETREGVAELCRHFYTQGWVSGTGGSITMKVHDDSIPKSQQLIVMSPSGVQKERMLPEDMYLLSSTGSILCAPSPKPYPHKPPKCTDCAPLFMKAYEMRNAGAVIHSHGVESCIVTMIQPSSKEFRITHMEMIKGIDGHGYHDELVVPIIENTAHEGELTESLSEAAECNHYLFDAAIKLYQLGLDWSTPSHDPIQRVFGHQRNTNMAVNAAVQNLNDAPEPSHRCIVLDIEGTATPISFVTDVLFPYARDNVGKHLYLTYDTEETQDDIKLLRAQVEEDLQKGVAGAVPIPTNDAGKDEMIASLVANVEAMINADRKITALKQLQGHIWRTGFQNNELEGVVFEDVLHALQKWHASGIKVYIYSSGSRESQRLIFGNSNYGDLRKYLCGYFDTTVGNKKETRSYFEISQSLGVDEPSDILFVTDVIQEAVAAKAAGLELIISVRPGNGPLPENHGFKTVRSFVEI
ncbi:probable bifunctional methylthioribulose-1-phosphate dehydratase/enolase-phosphatase E1 1 isoform X2 [Telopea speciosissima]|uniref:probable bifunctional methylthioribulose-1-phosphate dehydratase/enolase-phosphatase E1 1 isoform X2 n=1 Tax=Telopea speciosissima TaxID=54955 RepID=UPI001CC4E953|nr:probable bifunctional methylthioribulose-1-phosphate dehydratase/enolase-phosphatase E1 1 isoform X2 [Telopea speciosissima]